MPTLQQIFQLCLRFNISNVVVMAESTISEFIGFYTYEMFTSADCFAEPAVKEVNRYEEGKLKYNFLFPTKFTNYFGCALKVSARNYAPLVTFDGDVRNKTQLKEMQRLGGIEGEILKLLAEWLNFTIQLRFTKEESVINFYLNSTGCFGDVSTTRKKNVYFAYSNF